MEKGKNGAKVQYDHVHIYVDELQSLRHYKGLESAANELDEMLYAKGNEKMEPEAKIKKAKGYWDAIVKKNGIGAFVGDGKYVSTGQDLAEQLIIGAGWRIVASNTNSETTTYMLSSIDVQGVRFMLTAKNKKGKVESKRELVPNHFSAGNISRFYDSNSQKAGVAVLGFEVPNKGGVKSIMDSYQKKHPNLLPKSYHCTYGQGKDSVSIGEVFAYYTKDKKASDADKGTVIRFIERENKKNHLLPGLSPCDANFPVKSFRTYCDHWVSNVFDRERFINTLSSVLGFTPKVDFNAGVVAAGEAIIESTVIGNKSDVLETPLQALTSPEQVYLPINNALSTVGHVHLFLNELGQGIQHIASRVSNLVSFISEVNFRREATGRGFSFLRIPRSYYGRLGSNQLSKEAKIPLKLAETIVATLLKKGLVSVSGITDLDISPEIVKKALSGSFEVSADEKQYNENESAIIECVLKSRYINLYKLLRDHLSSETYVQIVRNKVLVDIQGNDILFQIFTSNILQRKANEESPFLEFIQRVCSERKDSCGKSVAIRPGCGGFGIRNFLTLFLSIEVSKAMRSYESAIEMKKEKFAEIAAKQVEVLTEQLDASNPILTAISDAMTAESDAVALAMGTKDSNLKEKYLEEAKMWRGKKLEGNKALQKLSDHYKAKMKEIRELEETLKKL